MRNFVWLFLPFFVLFFVQTGSAQLYVGSNSYVFNKGSLLFVKGNLELNAASSNFYLRNQGQLLQGTTSTSNNRGLGKLSVFQEGTTNNFAYNYWCSPVGGSAGVSGNEAFGIAMLNQPTTVTASTPAVILSSSQYNGLANPLSISSAWIYKFLSSSQYSQWIAVGSASSIQAGEGFTMKGTSGTDNTFSDLSIDNNPGSAQRYDFRGRPNDGDIEIQLAAGKRTLTGNPYPSAIDLKAFLLGATASTGVAYFWEQDKTVNSHLLAAYKGGYGVYSPMGGATVAGYGTMGVYTPAIFYAYDGSGTTLGAVGVGSNYERRFCPIGQGFMLEGASTGSVWMENQYRVYQKEGVANYSQFERSADSAHNQQRSTLTNSTTLPEIPSVSGFDYTTVSTAPIPQIRLNVLLNNQAIRQNVLAFHPAATDGADFAMDAHSPDTADMDAFFLVDNQPYTIDAIDFNIQKRIPMGFKNPAQASFRVKVAEMINFAEASNVYLHDKVTDVYYDILNGEYEFTLPAGTNNDRYEVTFVNQALDNAQWSAQDFDVVQNNVAQNFTITNPSRAEIRSVGLFDLTGKQIFTAKDLGNQTSYKFPTSMLSDAIYVVKITTNSHQDFGKKIPVYNGVR
ncbi:T9SS type A sorting domain-containing protein [Flavobacterium sp. CYK-55]|uniref:T9SS type A sorting domain-containing protein n=1 Tax=Flavobacterium sp. CYK-55 TaxID=2835529 RepID=UPI001BD0C42A|nr:T9SS type A sorting domain-containing protein [Flavobacterium sp. CYK-55]MBS7785706.1 T9SS type A sorting domain-containing protein [Flavobacterium sp. CYK-55]